MFAFSHIYDRNTQGVRQLSDIAHVAQHNTQGYTHTPRAYNQYDGSFRKSWKMELKDKFTLMQIMLKSCFQ